MFTYPRLTQIYPLHAPPYHSGIHGIKNTPTRLYKWIPAATAAPKGIPWCDISLLGNLPGRSLATYKYAPCWQTRDISYIILAYKAGIRYLPVLRFHPDFHRITVGDSLDSWFGGGVVGFGFGEVCYNLGRERVRDGRPPVIQGFFCFVPRVAGAYRVCQYGVAVDISHGIGAY